MATQTRGTLTFNECGVTNNGAQADGSFPFEVDSCFLLFEIDYPMLMSIARITVMWDVIFS